jgi:hypothetical protein
MGCRIHRVRLTRYRFYPLPHDSSTLVLLYRMGTSAKNAGSQENFTKIDKEYVEPFFDHFDKLSSYPPSFFLILPSRQLLISHGSFRYVVNAAKFAKTDKEQRLVYLSVRCSFELRLLQFTCHHIASCSLSGPIPNHRFSTRVVKV